MPESDPQNLNFYWSTLFVRALFEQGVSEVVISPGSRSTPLTLAFAAHPGFGIHSCIDERSAAFLALGLAKGSGNPAALVCTSGTAVANYFPAVIEASQSGVPLLVLSADRPPHLRSVGASQTINQLKLFGDYPVFFHEMGEPNQSPKSHRRVQLAAKQAVDSALNLGGVSHLNFPFSKPFEPSKQYLKEIEEENKKHDHHRFPGYNITDQEVKFGERFWSDLVSAERPLIVVGPARPAEPLDVVNELAKTLQAPILAEPASGIPSSKYTITGFDGFLRMDENLAHLQPDLILRFGAEPVSTALNYYLKLHADCHQIRFSFNQLFEDQSLTSSITVPLAANLYIPEISGSVDKNWMRNWRRFQKKFNDFRDEQLHPSTPLTDGYVFHALTPLIPKKAFTMLSNSFPVRDFSLFTDFGGRKVFVNRGAAGIDGITSTAMGLSKALTKAGVLFIGDIAFLHDSNALLSSRTIDQTLIIIILNNGGGTIFRMLPIDAFDKRYTQLFETPQYVSIAALCRAHKIHHDLVSRPEQLLPAFEKRIEKPGVHVIECITDPDESMAERRTLWGFTHSPD